MGTQADYSHEVAREIDDEVRKLIEAAHTEAWEILTEYRDVLDTLAGELLEKETLHRAELRAIFADVDKRPRLTTFDDFGGRIPSDKPPIKTPGELAIERGEPWPQPVAGAGVQGRDRTGQPGRRGRRAAEADERQRRPTVQRGSSGRPTAGRPARPHPARLRRPGGLARARAGRRRQQPVRPAPPPAAALLATPPQSALPAVSASPYPPLSGSRALGGPTSDPGSPAPGPGPDDEWPDRPNG